MPNTCLRMFSRSGLRSAAVIAALCLLVQATADVRAAEPDAGVRGKPLFPAALVKFEPHAGNPVFTAAGPGHWDARIRERGWILRDDDGWHLWYTGYDGTREGQKLLGYATSPDGFTWTRYPGNPLAREHWVEDMMVVPHGDMYYMFAEGREDRAHLLTSKDRVNWTRAGQLDVRNVDGTPIEEGPYGTPTAWFEDGTWYLFYERRDLGIWLATSRDLQVWTNVRDDPVLLPGPDRYDRDLVALNQIVKHDGRYYAYYHGGSRETTPVLWSTAVAVSDDLLNWTKYPGNPLTPPEANQSSGILVHDGRQYRLYTMHDRVDVHLPARPASR